VRLAPQTFGAPVRARCVAALAAVLSAGCPAPAPVATTTLTSANGLLTITGRLGKNTPFLIQNAEVRVRVDGELFSSANGKCTSRAGYPLSCDLGQGLTLSLQSDTEAGGLLLTASVSAQASHSIDGFELLATRASDASLSPPGHPRTLQYLHNGYQSWSFSGALQVPDDMPLPRLADIIQYAAPDGMVGSSELVGLSSHCAVIDGGDGTAMVLGFVSARAWQGAVGLESIGGRFLVSAFDGFTGDSLTLSTGLDTNGAPLVGQVVSETLLVQYAATPTAAMAAYGTALREREGTRNVPTPPQNGWFSWNQYFTAVDQPTVLKEAAALQGLAGSSDFNLVEIDDGWETGWGDWTPNPQFEAIADLAAAIHANGQRLGLWVAPFVVETTNPLVAAHPDWWLETLQGQPFVHVLPLGTHQLKVIDLTNPDALAWAVGNLTALEGAGVDFFKLDYLYAAALDGRRQDPTSTGVGALTLGLQAVFDGLQHASVNLCGVPWLHAALAPPSTMRVGTDVSLDGAPYGFVFISTAARDLDARAFGPLALRSDPDQFLLGPLTADEEQTAVVLQAMAGETFSLSDNLGALSPVQRATINRAIGLGIAESSPGSGLVPRGLFDAAGSVLLGTTLGELLSNPNEVQSRLPSVVSRGAFLSATNWGDDAAEVDLDLAAGETVSPVWGPAASGGKVLLPSHATGLFRLSH